MASNAVAERTVDQNISASRLTAPQITSQREEKRRERNLIYDNLT